MLKKVQRLFSAVWLLSMANVVLAANKVTLDNASNADLFGKFRTLMQDWIDFVQGPFGQFVVFAGVGAGACLWVWYPKQEGLMQYVWRGAIATMILFFGGSWLTSLTA